MQIVETEDQLGLPAILHDHWTVALYDQNFNWLGNVDVRTRTRPTGHASPRGVLAKALSQHEILRWDRRLRHKWADAPIHKHNPMARAQFWFEHRDGCSAEVRLEYWHETYRAEASAEEGKWHVA